MPEGPELHLSSLFINRICRNRIFCGKIQRNPIHKCADIDWDEPFYKISAESRGKELKLHLQSVVCDVANNNRSRSVPLKGEKKPIIQPAARISSILFTFGMSGMFEWTKVTEKKKHSHLSFLEKTEPNNENNAMALSFVDYRRFGKWYQNAGWSQDRGPCVIYEFDDFVNNVVNNLNHSAFNKPICEVMLDQRFFSGIGNYLRAEILFRCKVAPFERANSVLMTSEEKEKSQKTTNKPSSITPCKERKKKLNETQKCIDRVNIKFEPTSHKECAEPENIKIKEEMESTEDEKLMWNKLSQKGQEILHLCHSVPMEVVQLGSSKYSLSDLYKDTEDGSLSFNNWLQCYYQDGMKNLADHNSRTIWFSGPAGPLAPKEQKSRSKKNKKSSSDNHAIKESKTSSKDTTTTVKVHRGKNLQKLTREQLKKIKDSELIQENGSNKKRRKNYASNVEEVKVKSETKRKRKISDVSTPVLPKHGKKRKNDSPGNQKYERKSNRITRSSLSINKIN